MKLFKSEFLLLLVMGEAARGILVRLYRKLSGQSVNIGANLDNL